MLNKTFIIIVLFFLQIAAYSQGYLNEWEEHNIKFTEIENFNIIEENDSIWELYNRDKEVLVYAHYVNLNGLSKDAKNRIAENIVSNFFENTLIKYSNLYTRDYNIADFKRHDIALANGDTIRRKIVKHEQIVYHIDAIGKKNDGFMFIFASKNGYEIIHKIQDGIYPLKTNLCLGIGHSREIISLAFSFDDRFLATGSMDNTAIVWDLKTGLAIKEFKGHFGTINSLAFSPNNNLLATASTDNTIKIWNVEQEKEIYTVLKHKNKVTGVVFSNSGKSIISSSLDSTIIITNIETKKELVIKDTVPLISIGINHETDNIFALDQNGDISFFNSSGQRVKKFIKNLFVGYNTGSISQSGKYICVNQAYDPTVLISAYTGEIIKSFKIASDCETSDISPNDKYIISGRGSSHLLDLETGETLYKFSNNNYTTCVKFSNSNSLIAIGDNKGEINLYDTESKSLIKTLKKKVGASTIEYSSTENKLFIGQGNLFSNVFELINNTVDTSVTFTNSDHNRFGANIFSYPSNISVFNLGLLTLNKLTGHNNKINHLLYNPVDQKLYSTSEDKTLRVWNINKYSQIDIMSLPVSPSPITFNEDFSKIAIGLKNHLFVQFLDTLENVDFYANNLHRTKILDVKYSPDGGYLVSCSGDNLIATGDNAVKFIDLKDSTHYNLNTDIIGISSIFFDNDSVLNVGGLDASLKKINLNSGRLIEEHTFWDGFAIDNGVSYNDTIYLGGANPYLLAISEYDKAGLYEKLYKSDRNFEIKVLSEDFNSIYDLNGHSDWISGIEVSNQLIITSSYDGTVKFWSKKDGSLISTLITDNNDFIIYTPDYYYYSSKNSQNIVGFEKSMRAYSFEQFDIKYNRPDIVLSRMGSNNFKTIELYRKAYEKRLQKLGIKDTTNVMDLHTPQIELTNKNKIPFITSENTIAIDFKAWDTKYLLSKINVWINNVPIFGEDGLSVKQKSTIEKQSTLLLNSGKNKIEISVHNEQLIESFRETFEITSSYKPDRKPNLYILGIGASKYKNFDNLKYVDNDIRNFVEIMKSNEGILYENIFADTLLNQNVLKKNVLSKKKWLSKASVNDIVIIYYSGHGTFTKDFDYFLFTYDIDKNNMMQKGLLFDELESLLDGIKPRKKLLLVNACKSGEFDNEKEVFEKMQSLFTELRKGTGSIVISSSGGDIKDFSFTSDALEQSVFGYSLIKSMEQSSKLEVSELKDELDILIPKLTRNKQKPTFRSNNKDINFRIW